MLCRIYRHGYRVAVLILRRLFLVVLKIRPGRVIVGLMMRVLLRLMKLIILLIPVLRLFLSDRRIRSVVMVSVRRLWLCLMASRVRRRVSIRVIW